MTPSLYRAYLCPAPKDDIRPSAYSAEVLSRAVEPMMFEAMQWAQYRIPNIREEAVIKAAICEAIAEVGGDAFRAASVLRAEVNWPCNYDLCRIINAMIARIPVALRYEERLWAVRNGIRFPAKTGEAVEWYDDNGTRYTGEVIALTQDTASAICRQKTGLVSHETKHRVLAEMVTRNKSREIDRQVGFRREESA